MIQAEELTKTFGHYTAVNQLSFTPEVGQVTDFLGPNGSGKTTAISMIVDLELADSDKALVAGKPFV